MFFFYEDDHDFVPYKYLVVGRPRLKSRLFLSPGLLRATLTRHALNRFRPCRASSPPYALASKDDWCEEALPTWTAKNIC